MRGIIQWADIVLSMFKSMLVAFLPSRCAKVAHPSGNAARRRLFSVACGLSHSHSPTEGHSLRPSAALGLSSPTRIMEQVTPLLPV